jgi:hypothetical protein
VLNEPLWKRFVAQHVDDRRACNDRFARFSTLNSAVLIARSGSKTVQLAAFLAVKRLGKKAPTLPHCGLGFA